MTDTPDRETLLEKREAIIQEFLKDEALLDFKKNQLLRLISLGRTRALTTAENTQMKNIRDELKAAGASLTDPATPGSPGDQQAAAGPQPAAQPLRHKMDVVKYLKARGWKVEKSAVYNHIKAGFLRPLHEGGYAPAEVDAYASARLRPSGTQMPPTNIDGAETPPAGQPSPDLAAPPGSPAYSDPLQRERLEAEVGKIKAQREHWEKRNQDVDKLVADLVGQALAERARFFRTDMENFFRGQASAMIALVEGDATKAPDLIDFGLTALENWLARFSEDRALDTGPLKSAIAAETASAEVVAEGTNAV